MGMGLVWKVTEKKIRGGEKKVRVTCECLNDFFYEDRLPVADKIFDIIQFSDIFAEDKKTDTPSFWYLVIVMYLYKV